ncbi:hypothetical protein [Streptomyces sp. NPDC020681]|uniref:hypothetical protein n=1 Tax=Streptomyces sp. NPDC020681 TaxID=3365083 RepID=UPI0037B1039D
MPAITVLFTTSKAGNTTLITLAAGLLVVAMIASLTGSIALAAVGAEQKETANLPPAVMFIAVPVVVSLVSVLAAFQVLAAIYLPTAKTLFAFITGAGGLAGAYFTSFAVGDSWRAGPSDPAVRAAWLPDQWIRSHEAAYQQANRVACVSAAPAVIGLALRLFDTGLRATETSVNWLIGVGLLLALLGTFGGVQRTSHPVNGDQHGLKPYEAYGTAISVGLYTLALMVYLP